MQVQFGAVARVAAEAKDLATVYTIAGRDGDAAADEVSVQRKLSFGMLDEHVIADETAGRSRSLVGRALDGYDVTVTFT